MDFPDSLSLHSSLFHHSLQIWQQEFPWLSLSPSIPEGLPDYILCLYRAVESWFLLDSQHWHIRVKGFVRECCLWFHLCLVRLIWVVLEIGGKYLYSYFFIGCWFQDLFYIAGSIYGNCTNNVKYSWHKIMNNYMVLEWKWGGGRKGYYSFVQVLSWSLFGPFLIYQMFLNNFSFIIICPLRNLVEVLVISAKECGKVYQPSFSFGNILFLSVQQFLKVFFLLKWIKSISSLFLFLLKFLYIYIYIYITKRPCGIVANVLDCDIVVSEFKFHLCYYIHFWTNTLRKRYKPLAVCWVVPLLFFFSNNFGIK